MAEAVSSRVRSAGQRRGRPAAGRRVAAATRPAPAGRRAASPSCAGPTRCWPSASAGVVTDPAVTRRLTAPFAVLFTPLLVVPVVLAFVAVAGWVLFDQGLAAATAHAFGNPALFLTVVAVTVLSAGFHEFGHAAAARYGGSTPGAMGFGIYLFWPAFYTDVTDSYRLGRAGRVRTDLGGLYFNALVVLASFAVWWIDRLARRPADRRHPGAADDPAAGAAAPLRRLPRPGRPHRRPRPLPAHRPGHVRAAARPVAAARGDGAEDVGARRGRSPGCSSSSRSWRSRCC